MQETPCHRIPTPRGEVSAILRNANQPAAVYVLAHGAGAGMDHAFMTAVAEGLAERGVSTLRFNFPYWEQGSRRPDRPGVLRATVAAAVEFATTLGIPVVAGGKSMGGRMAAYAAAEAEIPAVEALVLLGFPLHPGGDPGVARWQPMEGLRLPSLFVQGDRDRLAELDLLLPRIETLPHGRHHVVEGADHGFHVLKRSGRTDEEALEEVCTVTSEFIIEQVRRESPS